MSTTDYDDTQGAGWLAFASIMLGLGGIWAVFEGILAIGRSKVFTPNATYVFSDLRTWGWIVLILGVLMLMAAAAIVQGSNIGRWFGIFAASINGIGQLMFLHAYPLWSVTMFTIDILIIYGLAAYGGRRMAG